MPGSTKEKDGFQSAGENAGFLKDHQEKKFTARKIAEWIFQTFPEGCAENSKNNTSATGEHALYPRLAEYLLAEFGIYSKRIDESRSSNRRGRNGNQWLHPDLVGLEDLSHDWHHEITACAKEYSDKKTRL